MRSHPAFPGIRNLSGWLHGAVDSAGLRLAEAELGEWTGHAICTDADPEIFPPPGKSGASARQICSRCPVRADCLAYALAAEEEFGIWGGLDQNERRTSNGGYVVRRPVRHRAREVRVTPEQRRLRAKIAARQLSARLNFAKARKRAAIAQ